jgi:selenocysteine-specific elongation factor
LCGLALPQLIGRLGVPWHQRQTIVDRIRDAGLASEIGGVLVSVARLSAVEDALIAAVTRYHASHPLEDGMPREEVRERLFASAPLPVFDHILRVLTDRKRIIARDRIALAGHNVALTDDKARARDAMIETLRAAKLTPPDPSTLATQIRVPLDLITRIATLLVRRAELVRAGDLLFHESALTQLKSEIQALKQSGAADTIDVAAFKDRYNITRKYAIPLLEYLDRERVTRRVGDARKIL